MNIQKSQDFERLSAYIDNQLSPVEKAALEARLAREPELQAGLNDLRRTVRALRSLPPVKPPRSFTLTPEQVGARARRGPLFPSLRLGAALATLILALVVAGDFARNGGLAAATRHDLTTQAGSVTSVSVPNAAPLITASPEASVDSFGASAPAPTETAGAGIAETPMLRMNTTAPSATPAGGDQQPLATPGPAIKTIATNETAAASDTPVNTAVSLAAVPPVPATATADGSVAQQTSTPVPGPSSLRVAEIVLAALALVLGAAAWFARRG
jgi:hypothetical protein